MSYHLLNAAPFNIDEDNKNEIKQDNYKRLSSSLNKTIKNRNINLEDKDRKERNARINKLLNSHDNLSNNDTDSLEDFKSPNNENYSFPPYPELQPTKKIIEDHTLDTNEDIPVNQENFQQLPSDDLQKYYEKYNNYLNNNYNSKINVNVSNEELLKKIDNILFLLEEQRETRTKYVTEELILYIFLGVFVIYLVDSFVKVGKYVR